MSKVKHTEGNLKVTLGASGYSTVISRDAYSKYPEELKIAYVLIRSGMDMDEAEANAAHLCHCWNCYNELLDAVRFVKDFFQKLEDETYDNDLLKALRQKFHAPVHKVLDGAIAKAEGKTE